MANDTTAGRPGDITAARSRTQQLATAALIAALLAGTSWINVRVGPVPFTLQTGFVILAAILLSPGWAAASVAVYVVLGAVGLPVFAGGTGGLGVLLGPTGGFLLAFPLAAAAGSAICRLVAGPEVSDAARAPWAAVAAAIVAEIVMYAIGLPWLAMQAHVGLGVAAGLALVPFLVPDAVKAVAAIVVGSAVTRALRARR